MTVFTLLRVSGGVSSPVDLLLTGVTGTGRSWGNLAAARTLIQ